MTDLKTAYRELLAVERLAWQRLCASDQGDSHDPALMEAWLAASRACSASRDAAADAVQVEDCGAKNMHRVALDAFPSGVQEAVLRSLDAAQRVAETDFGVCIADPAAGTYACLAARDLQQLSKLAVDLVDSGFALTDKIPEGCGCDYVFDPIR